MPANIYHLRLALLLSAAATLSAACSSPTPAGGCPVGFTCTPADDSGASAGDAAVAQGDTVAEPDGAADTAVTDSGPSVADTGVADAGPMDAGLDAGFDAGNNPVDTGGSGTPDVGKEDAGQPQPVGHLYAHTKDSLYFLDVAASAFKKVAAFTFDKNAGLVTDIALNKWGNLFAVTFKDLFQCNRDNGKCVWLAALPQEFNGLTFIPEGVIDPNEEALVGIAGLGTWYHIQFGTGKVTLKPLGSYGGGWWSSGDAFSVVGVGTYATLKKCNGCDNYLAEVDPKTGKILKLIGKTGSAKGLFGLAWWAGVFYGVSNDGNIYVLDVKTGDATQVKGVTVPKDVQWWGAGVSTRAGG